MPTEDRGQYSAVPEREDVGMTAPDIYVNEVDALARFRPALAEFGASSVERIVRTRANLAELERWILERERHWEEEIRRRTRTVDDLDAALRHCMGAPEPGQCHHIAADLARAQHELGDADEALRCCRAWLVRLSAAGDEFRRAASAMESAVDGPLAQGTRMLSTAHKDLTDYLAATTKLPAL